jgi:tetratricopeptide (TPR) repeat protein
MRSRFEAAVATRALTPFVGREDELRTLLTRWERALDGDGQAVVIIGEAGIGKSRLVRRFHEAIAETPHTWLEAGAGAFFQNTPFYPIGETLRQFTSGDQDPIANLARRLEAAGLAPAEVMPLLAPLLNLLLPSEYQPLTLPPDQERRRLLASLVEWMLGSARTQPLVSVIEDLHWADPSTLELIQLLVAQGATAPLLLLYTARPEFHVPWPLRAHHAQITLNRLSARDVRAMIAEVTARKALSDQTVTTVVERTGGVPLFVEELTRAVLESGDGKLSFSAIPVTLRDSLMARLDRLESAKEVAQIGAVIGSEFSYELLRRVHPIPEPDLQQALRSLADAELLYVRGIAPDATYQFKHALIRDAAYEALLKSRRKELHLSVARTIDKQFPALKEAHPEVLARHWTEAGETEIAIQYFKLAADQTAARGAMSEAVEQYARALELLRETLESRERDRRELALLVGLGTALWGAKSWSHPESHRAFARSQELAEKLGETQGLISILFGLWGSAVTRGQVSASQEFAERMLRLAESAQDRASLCAGHATLGYTLSLGGRLRVAQEHLESARSYLDETDSQRLTPEPVIISVAGALQVALFLGFPDRARRLVSEALCLAERRRNSYDLGFVLLHAGGVYRQLRDPEALLENAAAMARIAKENPAFAGQTDEQAAEGLFMLGHHEEAIVCMRRAMASSEEAGLRVARARELNFEAQVLAGERRIAEALAKLADALHETEEVAIYRPWVLRLRGDLLIESGADVPEVDTAYREAIECAQAHDNKWYELQAATHFARWLKVQDRREEARTMLAEIYNWFTEGFDTADLKDAKALLDELSA